MLLQGLKRISLGDGELERVRGEIVSVGLERLHRAYFRRRRTGPAIMVRHDQRPTAQVIRREIGSKVSAMSEDGAVLHQPVA
jgi:hypothetical protein